jgi:hypothetical protein
MALRKKIQEGKEQGNKGSNNAEPEALASKKLGLSLQQKVALISGAIIIFLVLFTFLFPSSSPQAAKSNYELFISSLKENQKSGIFIDMRDASGPAMRQKLMQCATDLIQSSDFYPRFGKDLLIYYCDNSGCISSRYRFDLPNYTFSYDNQSIAFSEALYAMRNRTYFYLRYSPTPTPPSYSSQYAEISISPDSQEECLIKISE